MSNKPRYGGPSILFRPNILVKINKEGHLVIAKTDDNVLTVYNNAGKKIETITLDIERKKIGAGEFEKAKKKTVEYFTEGSRMQWLAKRMIKLDYKPIYLNVFLTGDKIVISEIARRDENGYPASTKLTYFDKNGKQTASKTVDGYMYYINEQGVFYKYYDSETNETFRFTTGIE